MNSKRVFEPVSARLSLVKACFMFSLALTLAGAPLDIPGRACLASAAQAREPVYVCPMDSDVKSSKPGKCHKCGMALREASTAAAPEAVGGEEGGSLPVRFPDTPVLDQDGRKLRFYTDLIKGKTVAINFIFTTCTTICPPLSATFRRVQQLSERAGREVALISISVDPATDVPERLKQYASKFKAGPGWIFITGTKPEIDVLLGSLGAYTPDKNDHTPMILVGNDRAGYWTRAYGLAPPDQIMSVLDEAAGKPAREANASRITGAASKLLKPGMLE